MIKAPPASHQLMERNLATVPKRAMAQVVGQANSLRQIFVHPQSPGHRPPDLGHLYRMGQPGPVIIPLRVQKDLSFVFQPPKSRRMDNLVPVSLVGAPVGVLLLLIFPAPGLAAAHGVGG